MDRGVRDLERLLDGHGEWQISTDNDEVIARCISCERDTIVSISFRDFSKNKSTLSDWHGYVRAQRRAYCHDLASNGTGRCLGWSPQSGFRKAGGTASILFDPAGDILIAERSILASKELTTGKFIGPVDAPALSHIQAGLGFVVRSFTDRY